jgi:putative oxygen-independent coproporphyrinogen III oxidase
VTASPASGGSVGGASVGGASVGGASVRGAPERGAPVCGARPTGAPVRRTPAAATAPAAAGAPAGRGAAVYVHVPFCRARCDYCAFVTTVGRDELMVPYVEACVAELRWAAGEGWGPAEEGRSDGGDGWGPGEGWGPAGSVFFGGGTPSRLAPEQVAAVLGAVERCHDAEVTLECNPEDVDAGRLAAWRAAGVTRLSVGVQSTVPAVLVGLGRRRPPRPIVDVLEEVAAAGFASWSVDLIIGGAGETDRAWRRTVEDVLGLPAPPPHVSAYCLIVEPGTPLARDPGRHPDDDAQVRRYLWTDATLTAAGYQWEEISNWARPGHECRHNWAYWTQGDHLGIGAAAHSHRRGRRWWNIAHLDRYLAALAAGRSPVAGGEVLDAEQRAFERLALALRTRIGVPVAAFDPEDLGDAGVLAGLVVVEGGQAVLTPRGRLVANELTARLRVGAAGAAVQVADAAVHVDGAAVQVDGAAVQVDGAAVQVDGAAVHGVNAAVQVADAAGAGTVRAPLVP